jgi:hypothetical protein
MYFHSHSQKEQREKREYCVSMKISCLLSTISPLGLLLLLCPVTSADVGQEKKQEEANDFRSITSQDHTFLRRFLPERLVNLYGDYQETYLRGSKSSVAAIDQGFVRGRHLDSVFNHCTPSLIDGHCVRIQEAMGRANADATTRSWYPCFTVFKS